MSTLGTALGLGGGAWSLVGCSTACASDLSRAVEAAGGRGRALLVVLVPDDESEGRARGEVWGALLNHGTHAQLADLAPCEVICARFPAVREAAPDALATVHDGAYGVVLEAGGPARSVDFVEPPPPDPASIEPSERIPRQFQLEEAHDRARMDALSRALRLALSPGHSRRLELERGALTNAQRDELQRTAVDGAEPALELVGAAPSSLLEIASNCDEGLRERIHTLLAAGVRARFVNQRPRGAYWASVGCGMEIEDHEDPSPGVACGMAFSARLSTRFLHFYVDEA